MHIQAYAVGPLAWTWLRSRRPARVLHRLPSAIYLVNEERRVLALVEEPAGPGPFHLLLPACAPLIPHLQVRQMVVVTATGIELGQATVRLTGATHWRPAAAGSYHLTGGVEAAINALPAPVGATAGEEMVYQALPALLEALRDRAPAGVALAVQRLAGLGPGLTPAGDDCLVGVMLGVWLLWSVAEARLWCNHVATAAIPRTATLAGEFVRAAAAGHFMQLWLNVAQGLRRPESLPERVAAALAWGDSSGRATLVGLRAALQALHGDRRALSYD